MIWPYLLKPNDVALADFDDETDKFFSGAILDWQMRLNTAWRNA